MPNSNAVIYSKIITHLLVVADEILSLLGRSCQRDPVAMEALQELTTRGCDAINIFCKLSSVITKIIPMAQKIEDQEVGEDAESSAGQEFTASDIAIMMEFLKKQPPGG